jgi:hypothetical protein
MRFLKRFLSASLCSFLAMLYAGLRMVGFGLMAVTTRENKVSRSAILLGALLTGGITNDINYDHHGQLVDVVVKA